jgi:hypothetical protein
MAGANREATHADQMGESLQTEHEWRTCCVYTRLGFQTTKTLLFVCVIATRRSDDLSLRHPGEALNITRA